MKKSDFFYCFKLSVFCFLEATSLNIEGLEVDDENQNGENGTFLILDKLILFNNLTKYNL